MRTQKKVAIASVLAILIASTFLTKTETINSAKHLVLTGVTETLPNFFPKVKSPKNIHFTILHTEGTVQFEINSVVHTGTINTTQEDTNGNIRVGGDFEGGTFCFVVDNNSMMCGVVFLQEERKCYIFDPTPANADIVWIEKKMSEIVCSEITPVPEGAGAVGATTTLDTTPITTRDSVPVFDSRIDSKTVLLLDFIGGVVQDPLWNGGKTINAESAAFTVDQIQTAFKVVAERYAAFNVNVTTDFTKYAKASVKSRMRAIFTRTNFISGYGGYAYISSLRNAGVGIYSPGIPCFIFTRNTGNAKQTGECAAHELGHTFGLSHDGATGAASIKGGTPSVTYYAGQGDWAPVMGLGYYKPIIQWSKGEYANANNKQDDLAIIAGGSVGYAAFDNIKTPILLSDTQRVVDVISNNVSPRYFNVPVLLPGSLTVTITVPEYGALNTCVEIKTVTGLTLGKNDTSKSLNTSITVPVTTGTYLVKVVGDGDGIALTTGYSNYSSIGTFIITGTLTSPFAGASPTVNTIKK